MLPPTYASWANPIEAHFGPLRQLAIVLDDGPDHPVFPGVGFIAFAELSRQRFETASDVVQVGQRVSCEFLQFAT